MATGSQYWVGKTARMTVDALHQVANTPHGTLLDAAHELDEATLALLDNAALLLRDVVDEVRTDRRLARRRERLTGERTA